MALLAGCRIICCLYELGFDIDFPLFVVECFSEAEPEVCLPFWDVTLLFTMKENEVAAFTGFLL